MDTTLIKKYDKGSGFSYTFGAFPTFELVQHKPDVVECVLVHSKLQVSQEIEKLFDLCKAKGIEIIFNDKLIHKIVDKENCFLVGVFRKYETLAKGGNNLVLVNPSDMGNLGTIMRTMLGFDFRNLIIVKPCVDYFNPKVIRASMGAIFSLNIVEMDSLDEYLAFSKNRKYPFMLKGKNVLGKFKFADASCDLIFGNEASGLPDSMLNVGDTVVIHHSKDIDSLNLPISVGIALYEFSK